MDKLRERNAKNINIGDDPLDPSGHKSFQGRKEIIILNNQDKWELDRHSWKTINGQ